MSKIVRLKPRDPRRGLRIATFVCQGIVFKESAGWYEVSDVLAEYLAEVRNDAENGESPLAFDVFESKEDALRFEEAARRRLRERADASDPIRVHRVGNVGADRPRAQDTGTLTTRDLPRADLPGDAEDLESDDLAADVAQQNRQPARAPRYVDPEDKDSAVEGGVADDEAAQAAADAKAAAAPAPVASAPSASVPGAPGSRSARRTASRAR